MLKWQRLDPDEVGLGDFKYSAVSSCQQVCGHGAPWGVPWNRDMWWSCVLWSGALQSCCRVTLQSTWHVWARHRHFRRWRLEIDWSQGFLFLLKLQFCGSPVHCQYIKLYNYILISFLMGLWNHFFSVLAITPLLFCLLLTSFSPSSAPFILEKPFSDQVHS